MSETVPTGDDIPNPGGVQEAEVLSSWALLIIVSLLLVTLLVSYALQRKKIHVVHESVVAIVLGMVAGLTIILAAPDRIQKMVTFDHSFFFNLLLPPIILNSAYDLNTRHFFRNLGSIMVFAFGGVLLSTLAIGLLVSMLALVGLQGLNLTFLECMMYGAILSSTDPVTVLSIFNQVKVEPQLYAVIFGESMLNDAVAIVLYSTLSRHQKAGTGAGLGQIILSFIGVFSGSFVIGVGTALAMALLMKHTDLHRFPLIESCTVILFAYSTYLLANATELSGIVALLFCGIALKRYLFPNLSLQSQRTTSYMFHVTAHLAESVIFIYLGLTIFTQHDERFRWALVLFVFLFILVGRAASVFPLAYAINFVGDAQRMGFRERLRMGVLWPTRESISLDALTAPSDAWIPPSHQVMLWWAGLRGAIAFALSMDIQTPSAPELRTTTLIVVVLSILIFGGTTPAALRRLKIRTGVVDNEDEGDVGVSTTVLSDTAISPPYSRRAAEHWFLSFDNRYVRPVFTHVKWRQPARRELFSESEAHASTELRETRVDSSHGDLATSLQAADQSSRNASRPKTSGRADSPSRKQRTTTRDQLTETEGESDAHDEQVALRTGGKLSARVRSGSAENE